MDQPKNVRAADDKTADTRRTTSTFPVKNVIDTMSAEGNFTHFVTGVKGAGLTDQLSQDSSYTLFAPTDEAFEKLAPGALQALMKNSRKLKAVLSYHVIAGHIEAKHVKAGDLMTLQGSTVKVETPPQEVRVNGARVTRTDLLGANGVIHAIDTVILPANWRLLAVAA